MLKIVYEDEYIDYANALQQSKLKRWENLCLTFALKCTMDPKHKQLFTLNDNSFHYYPTKFQPLFVSMRGMQNHQYPTLLVFSTSITRIWMKMSFKTSPLYVNYVL